MLIKYKTIIWDHDNQLLHEVQNIDFCCLEAENAYENKLFIFNNNNEQNRSLHIIGENNKYETIYLKINYCPFCKSEIKTEEIEKVKIIRKTIKETIQIDRVIFEEIPLERELL